MPEAALPCPSYGTLPAIENRVEPKQVNRSTRIYLVAFSVSVVALVILAVVYPSLCLYNTPEDQNIFSDNFVPGRYGSNNRTAWCERHVHENRFQSVAQCVSRLEHQDRIDRRCWMFGGKISALIGGSLIIFNIIAFCALITPLPGCNLFRRARILNMDPLHEATA